MTNLDTIPGDLIDTKAAARLIHNAHIATIRRWIQTGKLKAYRLAGRRFLVSKAEVLQLIQPHVVVNTPPPITRELTDLQKRTKRILEERGVG